MLLAEKKAGGEIISTIGLAVLTIPRVTGGHL